MTYLGVDPGASGGLAALLPDGAVRATKMLKTPDGILDWLLELPSPSLGVLELVTGYVPRPERANMAHQGQPGHSMFSFGVGYGMLQAFLLSASIKYTKVPPRVWQWKMAPSLKGVKEGRKRQLKEVAQRLFPDLTVTLATADALLLALYCKRQHRGIL